MAEAESSGSSKHATSRQVRTGRLYMIDLAGSERAANTKVTPRYHLVIPRFRMVKI